MGKYSKYSKKFRKEWLEMGIFKNWLEPGPSENARCKICNIDLRAQLADLKRHMKTINHTNKATVPTNQNVLTQAGIVSERGPSNAEKEVDLKLATFVGMHTSINTMDHLCDLLKELGEGSSLEDLRIVRMHRTKCSQIIKKVLAPSIKHSIIEDINNSNSFYSLILDESTDVSVSKYLCLCVRYFSHNQGQITTEYLGLIPVIRTTAEDLYQSVTTFLNNNNLETLKLVGIGTDGANNLCGRNHSLYTLLKRDIPQLQLIKCVCHSVHLCSEKAAAESPATIEFLLRETYNWFHISPCRKDDYKQIYDLININDGRKQHKLVQLAPTRWLSRYKAIEVILEQWIELKTFFTQVNNKEKCYTSRQLESMYNDPINFLFLLFLKPLLRDLQSTNLLFQSSDADFYKVFEALHSLLLNILRRILKPIFLYYDEKDINKKIHKLKEALNNELAFLNYEEVDYGFVFLSELEVKEIGQIEKNNLKQKCFSFLKTLAKELVQRFPENFKVLQMLRNLSPTVCLSQLRPSLQESIPLEFINCDIEQIENEWRILITINWANYFPNGDIPQNPTVFWAFVKCFKNALGDPMFPNLSRLCLKLLTLPLSNAVVERVFSVMNIIKTKTRNKLIIETLDSILMLRIHCKNNDWCCCRKFKVSKKMIELFNYKIYDTINQDDNLQNEVDSILGDIDV